MCLKMHTFIKKTRKLLPQNLGYGHTKEGQFIVDYLVSTTFILRAFSLFPFSHLRSSLWFLFPTMNHILLWCSILLSSLSVLL